MAIEKYDIDTIPTLVKTLDTDETEVLVTVYDRVARLPIALSADAATQYPAGSGAWYWDVAFTTRPDNGQNQYEAFLIGTTYGQRRRILFDWIEDTDKYKGAVYLDTTGAGTAGQGRYVGTSYRPSSNLTDAKAIAVRLNTNRIIVKGTLILDSVVDGYIFESSRGYAFDTIVLANQSAIGTQFRSLTMTGQLNSTNIYCEVCFLVSVLDFTGGALQCTFIDTLSIKAGGALQGTECNAYSLANPACVVDCQGNVVTVAMSKFSGLVEFINVNNTAVQIFIEGSFNYILGATVLKGILIFAGVGLPFVTTGRVLANVGLEYVKINVDGIPGELYIQNQMMPGSIYDTFGAYHTDAGTYGKEINNILANIGTPVTLDGGAATLGAMLTKIADDNGGADFNAQYDSLNKISDSIELIDNNTWDALAVNHDLPGSFGRIMKYLMGMAGGKVAITGNQMIVYKDDNVTEVARFNLFDADGNATMRNIFSRTKV